MARETTLSFIYRLALHCRIGIYDVAAELVQDTPSRSVLKDLRMDGEVYLNAAARTRLSAFCRTPEADLGHALPAFTALEPVRALGDGPAGQFRFGTVVPALGVWCSMCTARRTGTTHQVRCYLPAHGRICQRHRSWMLGTHRVDGTFLPIEQVDLTRVPQIPHAQRRHLRLVRQTPDTAAAAFTLAQAVVTSWWAQQWPQETQWPQRTALLTPHSGAGADADPGWWRILLREAVTYPETVALAAELINTQRRQSAAGTRGHVPLRLADAPDLLAALAQATGRPWLPQAIASEHAGPLYTWLRASCRPQDLGEELWKVRGAHSPRALHHDLASHTRSAAQDPAARPQPQQPLGLRQHPGHLFAVGLVHARAYAAVHGHLAAPAGARIDGFAIGQWLSNQRSHTAMSPQRAAVLDAIDPWWRTPWPVLWQRAFYRARAHVQAHGTVDAPAGFPGTTLSMGEWLYNQCTAYPALHPQQQRLLAELGITAEAARTARPRRRNIADHFTHTLAQAKAYAAVHGHLLPEPGTRYNGVALSQWLSNQRSRDRRTRTPSPRALALSAIDPWWNPPWEVTWQRAYHHARDLCATGQGLDAPNGFPGAEEDLRQWLLAQCHSYPALHGGQQDLLAAIGITAITAATAPPYQAPAPRKKAQRSNPDAYGQQYFDAGLPHARAHAETCGHLVPAFHTVHDAFPLGQWLARQRAQAGRGQQPLTNRQSLTALDPWWNPPWGLAWQRAYHHARTLRPLPRLSDIKEPALRAWLYLQCTRYSTLHPGQQHLLDQIGITADAVRAYRYALSRDAPTTPDFDTGQRHAAAYAAAHGHLVPTAGERWEGFPLGRWLSDHRMRADRRAGTSQRSAALDTIDPWWNPPWDLTWQRAYHRTRTTGHDSHQTRKWTLAQQAAWPRLHPDQQHLLTAIGITEHTPPIHRRRTRSYPDGAGLEPARAYTALHGHLSPDKHATHHGFPLGQWLTAKRSKARHGTLSPRLAAALDTLDPWWNPPWPYEWTTRYHQARTTTPPTPATQRWTTRQHRAYPRLHPHQQHLLNTIGITPPHPRPPETPRTAG
ncbi:helicase associated domain-containing protein [Streptacidiphilus sp. N1-12]|uniref:Helicase associated domain-containing protein n=2 Tax=Streptacidiphilus alkalitolerans TaxID=3342712 RepID=A0ABV6WQX3_9ACTN